MIIFNTTFHVEDDRTEEFIVFMKSTYISKASESGFLFEPRFARIFAQHEESGISYSLQFKVKNTDTLDHWFTIEGNQLHKELSSQFGDSVLSFVTLMEEIEL